ncbi:hypothetical protein DFJ74DRAFT_678820 [Hyaloraphidium curvatum]|nr:hypothetical protein DFJ74DRAFT_678820 [Hyaloraphidium curvatum]
MLGRSLMDAAVYFTMSYSSIVTLAPATWTHWWSALFAAVACAVAPILFSLVTGISMIFLGIPQMELSRRLTLRAAHLSLASFFAQIERGSTCIDAEDAPTAGGPEPLYLVLHRRLTAEWISRANATTGGRYFLVLLSFCAFVAGAVYATAGGCLPAWPVLLFAITVLDVTRNLFVAAASNSGVTDCSATHGRAGTRVRELLAAGGPRGPGEHRSLKAHGALLSSLANDEAYKGSFMGFRVGYGAARTFVVTMFTVLVGVWSILRGIGIYLSADNVCRGGDLS